MRRCTLRQLPAGTPERRIPRYRPAGRYRGHLLLRLAAAMTDRRRNDALADIMAQILDDSYLHSAPVCRLRRRRNARPPRRPAALDPHQGTHPEHLGQSPNATYCAVSILPAPDTGATVIVADDGLGFADIKDAWTLLGDTAKRSNPSKRGPFNLGEKEIISVSRRAATVATVGHTIDFPPLGGRFTSSNDRAAGTSVTSNLDWNPNDIP